MSFTASFNLNGGSGSFPTLISTTDSYSNTEYVILPNKVPTRSDGKVFMYWTDGTITSLCRQPYFFNNNSNVTLTAVYTQTAGRAILFNENGGTPAPHVNQYWRGASNLYITSDHNAKLPEAFATRTGYSFVGWSDSASTSPTDSANIAAQYGYYTFSESKYPAGSVITMYAIWQKRNPVYVNIPSGKSLSGVYVSVPSGKTLKDIYVNR